MFETVIILFSITVKGWSMKLPHLFFKAIIILLLLMNAAAMAQSKLKKAPANPDYIKFINEFKNQGTDEVELQAAPAPYILNFSQYFEQKKSENPKDFPVAYDMRTAGPGGTSLLTSVKHQLSCGACWAFATYGSMESTWKIQGLGDNDLSENNLKNCHGFDLNPCVWGHHFMSTAYLVRGSGPIAESFDPYNPTNPNCTQGINPVAYIPISRYLPEDHDAFKETIMNTGAVYNTFRSVGANYQWINGHYTFCYQGPNTTSHAIAIVGWNDTLTTACGEGAWLAKNQYGTVFGEDGYFYISYQDTLVLKYNSIWPEREEYDEGLKIYQYDSIGGWPFVGYSNPIVYGLIRFVAEGDQFITSIGTYTVSYGSYLSAEIYDDFDGTNLSGILATVPEQYCDYPGFWRLDLPEAMEIFNGDDFYIKVKYNSPGEDFPMAIETTEDGYTVPYIETGKCWTSENAILWEAAGIGTPNEFDLCIKVFAFDQAKLDLKVFLEGPFNGMEMDTQLNAEIPLSQPFITEPWSYQGAESISMVPSADIVDWVLIELRETDGDAASASSLKIIARQAALLKNNGKIVGLDGQSLPSFKVHERNNLYVVVYHRYHLGVMSSIPLTKSAGVYPYDFTIDLDKAYNNGQKFLGNNLYGMIGGDGIVNGEVNLEDKTGNWNLQAGESGYKESDFNLDSHVDNPDKSDIWLPNFGQSSQIPE